MSQGIHFVCLQKSQGSLSQGITFVVSGTSVSGTSVSRTAVSGTSVPGNSFSLPTDISGNTCQKSQGIKVKSLKK